MNKELKALGTQLGFPRTRVHRTPAQQLVEDRKQMQAIVHIASCAVPGPSRRWGVCSFIPGAKLQVHGWFTSRQLAKRAAAHLYLREPIIARWSAGFRDM